MTYPPGLTGSKRDFVWEDEDPGKKEEPVPEDQTNDKVPDSAPHRRCSSCKSNAPPSAFDEGRATCRSCLRKRRKLNEAKCCTDKGCKAKLEALHQKNRELEAIIERQNEMIKKMKGVTVSSAMTEIEFEQCKALLQALQGSPAAPPSDAAAPPLTSDSGLQWTSSGAMGPYRISQEMVNLLNASQSGSATPDPPVSSAAEADNDGSPAVIRPQPCAAVTPIGATEDLEKSKLKNFWDACRSVMKTSDPEGGDPA